MLSAEKLATYHNELGLDFRGSKGKEMANHHDIVLFSDIENIMYHIYTSIFIFLYTI